MRRLGAILCLALTLTAAVPERAAADSVERTWSVGDEPFGVVIDPTDGRVYVANSKIASWPAPSITVVDPSRTTGGVTQLMTSGAPAMLALDPIHRRLYSSNQDRTLQVFDLTTMSLEETFDVGGLGVVVDPATRRVFVVDHFANGLPSGPAISVVAIDGETNTIVDTEPAPPAPPGTPREIWWGLALDPQLNRLYVTSIESSAPRLVVLDAGDLSRVDTLPLSVVPRFAIAVDEVLHRVYLAGEDRNGFGLGPTMLYALDGSTLATLDSVQVSGFPGGIALAPATNRIYVTNACACPAEPWGYSEIDDRTLELVRFHATPWHVQMPAMHPDGSLYVGVWRSSVDDELVAISRGNTPPSMSTVTFSPAIPTTDSTLRANDDAFDVDLPGAPGSTDLTRGYEWSRNGVSIPGETSAELDLTRTGTGDRGDTITVRVTVTDRHGSSVSATGSVLIANAAPSVLVSLDDTAPRTNDVLDAIASGTDADGDPVALAYQWSRNGATIVGANAATLDLAAAGDRGDVIAVRATATDGHGGASVATAAATVANTPPSAPALVLSTTAPTTNEVLRATAGSVDVDGDVLYYEFAYYVNSDLQWYSGRRIETSMSFDLALPNWGDRGDSIRVVAWAYDGQAVSPFSEVSAVVAMTVDVTLSDTTPTTRDTLTATALVADPSGPALTYTYVWRVNGVVKRTTSATTATTDSLDLAPRGVSRQGDLVVCEVLASDDVSTGTGIAQALVTNKR